MHQIALIGNRSVFAPSKLALETGTSDGLVL